LGDFRNQVITTGLKEQAKIQASDKEASDEFGWSVSISGDGNTALIGVPREDTGGDRAGAAYIFTRSGTTWTQQQKIQASDKEQVDRFGYSVFISSDGNTAIVGAHGEDTGATSAGAAYIFTRSGTTWTQQAKIQASDKEANDQFGYSVSISGGGNIAVVGAYLEDTGGDRAGAAYIFTRSGTTWTQQQKIQASNLEGGDEFGWSVSISSDGNTAIVGARFEDTGASGAGAAYIFIQSGYYI
jgi:N-acetylglucosamine kinase-like BadF-type ATPase